ncbi:hypothetical protein F0562_017534 [Nyssa sinensis]|uniref:Uncharacterized protein n=1 Tax=Nyssa sinensis TaxID=561372 RepID=A0A5J4ZH76_9ASTE|nr:hypothetical protein F0562_017534 [Nyssa sinensis]
MSSVSSFSSYSDTESGDDASPRVSYDHPHSVFSPHSHNHEVLALINKMLEDANQQIQLQAKANSNQVRSLATTKTLIQSSTHLPPGFSAKPSQSLKTSHPDFPNIESSDDASPRVSYDHPYSVFSPHSHNHEVLALINRMLEDANQQIQLQAKAKSNQVRSLAMTKTLIQSSTHPPPGFSAKPSQSLRTSHPDFPNKYKGHTLCPNQQSSSSSQDPSSPEVQPSFPSSSDQVYDSDPVYDSEPEEDPEPSISTLESFANNQALADLETQLGFIPGTPNVHSISDLLLHQLMSPDTSSSTGDTTIQLISPDITDIQLARDLLRDPSAVSNHLPPCLEIHRL